LCTSGDSRHRQTYYKNRGALVERRPIRGLPQGLEKDFHRQLSNAGIARLSGPEGAEGVAAEFIKGTNLIGAIHSAGAGVLWGEIGMVQDVEVLRAKLESQSFGNEEVLGELYVPVSRVRQAKNILADISEGAKDRGIIAGCCRRRAPRGDLGRLKSRGIEPTHAADRRTARGGTISAYSGYQSPSIIANAGAGEFGALQNGDGTAARSRNDSTELVITEQMMNQRPRAPEAWGLPNIRTGKNMGVIKARRPIVKLMAVEIVERKGGVSGIEA
jgi:hypothetical protein